MTRSLAANIFLVIHILCGYLAFIVAPVAMLTQKGGKTHRRWGKFYFWTMAGVASTAIVLTLLRPNPFLAFIAVFSFYLAFAGYRALFRKRSEAGQGATWLDWTGSSACLAGGIGLIYMGAFGGLRFAGYGLVAIVFGLAAIGNAAGDMRKFVRPSQDKNAWWFDHMSGMLASYIAAWTAFSAVNLTILPVAFRWLWPTAVGSIGIAIWTAYYKRKFAQRAVAKTNAVSA